MPASPYFQALAAAPVFLPDPLLSSLCKNCPILADDILELREQARRGGEPGKCARCYFRFSGLFEGESCEEFEMLKGWFSKSLAVAVMDGSSILEVIPFEPMEGEDLDGYCGRIMSILNLDRTYPQLYLELRFIFRS